MGNRAIIKFKDKESGKLSSVYIHYNGGPESVFAFLRVMEVRGYTRMDYAPANFAATVVEFFRLAASPEYPHDGLSVAVFNSNQITDTNNGIYTVSFDKDCPTRFKINWEYGYGSKKTLFTHDINKAIALDGKGGKYVKDFDYKIENKKKFEAIVRRLLDHDKLILEHAKKEREAA